MSRIRTRAWLGLAAAPLFALAACSPDQQASPTAPTPAVELENAVGASGCTAPYALSPSNMTLGGEPSMYTWYVDVCRTPDRIEIRDHVTNSLVHSDSDPGSTTFQVNSRFEYHGVPSGTLTRGRQYRWRVRSKLADAGSGETLGPWSPEVTFGVAPVIPSTSASVSGGYPRLTWSATTGATSYKIYRQYNETGAWEYWDSTSSTSWTGFSQVDSYRGTSLPPYGTPWLAYRVTAVSSQGLESGYGSQHYFDPASGPVLE